MSQIPFKYRWRLWAKRVWVRTVGQVSPVTRFLFLLAFSNALAPGWMKFHLGLWIVDVSELARSVANGLPRSPL